MKTNRHCLIVTYNYPPQMTPHSLRWHYLTKELSGYGFVIHVVAAGMPARFHLRSLPPPEQVEIDHIFPGPFFHLTYRFSREEIRTRPGSMDEKNAPSWSMLQHTHAFALRALQAIGFPDAHFEWYPFALQACRKVIERYPIEIIISSSEPRTCHMVGYSLNQRTGIPWIADYGDPWIYPVPLFYEPRFKKNLLRRFEQRLLERVDGVSVATQELKLLYQTEYPGLLHKPVRVIEQGYDEALVSETKPIASEKFRIVYCGSLYRGLRNPLPFLEAVTELAIPELEVVVAGRINEYAELLQQSALARKVRFLGFLHHHTALALEKGASVLLHIGNAGSVQVPGKIYEYFGVGRPILALAEGNADPSARPIERSGRGLVVPNETSAIIEGLRYLHRLWQQDAFKVRFNLDESDGYTWRHRAGQLTDLIETVISRDLSSAAP